MNSKKNIVLIGMPGSGKTTIGSILADYLDYEFIDTDHYIENLFGMPITKLFEKGEEYFRDLESKAYKRISGGNSKVIATGGGAVKSNENMLNLNRDAVIIFIDRPLEHIANDVDFMVRPLLKEGKESLIRLFNERSELYRKYAKIIITNDGTVREIIAKIIAILEEDIDESNTD